MDNRTQQQQDKLLKTILEQRFFNPWRGLTKFKDERSLVNDANLELYITSTCNQKCEYCYLQKYPKLYPAKYNKPELILHNLELMCRYIMINNYQIPLLDLYSGEIWHNKFGWDVLDIIYKYLEQGMQIGYILITSNCSFVSNPEALQRIQTYINKFREIQCPIVFSASVDGKIVDDISRPRNNKEEKYDDDFYELLGSFAQVNNFLFHPMVSSHNVKYWIENYKWWKEYLSQYGFDKTAIMMLEVRNDGWTDENIEDYCKFLDVLMDEFLYDDCKGDSELFAKMVADMRTPNNIVKLSGYVPWVLGKADSFPGCTVANSLTVRLGDLAICPCHRQAYAEYLYGNFVVENDEIVDIKAINTAMAIKILMTNVATTSPVCSKCIFNYCCLHGCLGSQLETGKDPFFPLENICKFFKAKYTHLFNYYREHGILDHWKSWSPNEPNGQMIATLLRINDKLESE